MGKYLDKTVVLNRIQTKCKEIECEFRGFVGEEYNGNKTKLILYCNKHKYEWSTTQFVDFEKIKGCHICMTKRMTLKEELAIKLIQEKCKELDYEFRGFVGGEYKKNNVKLILYCKKHKLEWKTTNYNGFMRGNGCPKCNKRYILTETEAIELIQEKCEILGYEFRGFVGEKWYGHKTKLLLYCKKHEFDWDTTNYDNFMRETNGCKICRDSRSPRITEKFAIKKIKKRCKEKNYEFRGFTGGKWCGVNTKLILYCNSCLLEWNTLIYYTLINTDHGCSKCAHIKNGNRCRKTQKQFIEESKTIHGSLYDYLKVNYINTSTEVCIICPIHGDFWITPEKHIYGGGCQKCSRINVTNKRRKPLEKFVEQANIVHDYKYDYSKVNYINSKTPVCIICPTHGEFPQQPGNHLEGNGCPICKTSKMEKLVRNTLNKRNILFEYHYRDFCWLRGKRSPLELDFYLTDYNIAIECQGEQHFRPIEYWGGEKTYQKIQERDKIKKELCEQHNVPLYYINYWETPEEIEIKLNKILENHG